MSVLFRSDRTVHTQACRYVYSAGVFRWRWADIRSPDELIEHITDVPWLHPCKVCQPLEYLKREGKP